MDKCRRRSSTLGQAVTALVVYAGWGMHDGTLLVWWGSGGLARTDGLGRLEILRLGSGIHDFGGDGPEMCCFLWFWAGGG